MSVCICLLLAATGLAFAGPQNDSGILKIGWSGSVSGWASAGGVLQWQGAQLARDIINERGGIEVNGNKYQIELVLEDDKSTTDGAMAAANKLVYEKDIKFMSGLALWLAAATKEICEQAKVLRTIIWTSHTPGEFGPDTPYTFLGNNATLENTLAILNYIKEMKTEIKSVVVVEPDDGADPYLYPLYSKWLKERGIEQIGSTIVFPNEIVDFNPIAAKLVSRKDADAILMINGWPNHAGAILKAVRELGDNRFFAAALPGHGNDVKAISGEQAADNFIIVGPVLGAPGTSPLAAEVEKRLMDKYGQISQLSLNAFNCVWVMTHAIEAAQSFDTTVVRDYWENMEYVDTLYGKGKMGGKETYGINHAVGHPCPIHALNKGKVEFLAWMDIQMP